MINETLARRNKENYSFSSYEAGSATAEFNETMKEAAEKIERAKLKVSEEGKNRLDSLFISYKSNYANWINRHNSNGAGHVSSMISGPANYNMRKHEKFLSREGKLWDEYENISNIDSRISAIITGDRMIKSDDENAIEKLQEKLAKAMEEHEGYKNYNVKARKEGKPTLAAYVMANSNGRIKGIKDRIAKLERIAKVAEVTPRIEIKTEAETNGIKIIDNLEVQRLQIIFPGKPESNVRELLKKNGFRWCPTNSAWQRYRSFEAEKIAKEIVSSL